MRYVSAAARGIRRAAITSARAVPVMARDLVGIAGTASIVYGIWQIHVPTAYIAAGMMAVAVAFAWARQSS